MNRQPKAPQALSKNYGRKYIIQTNRLLSSSLVERKNKGHSVCAYSFVWVIISIAKITNPTSTTKVATLLCRPLLVLGMNWPQYEQWGVVMNQKSCFPDLPGFGARSNTWCLEMKHFQQGLRFEIYFEEKHDWVMRECWKWKNEWNPPPLPTHLPS